MPPRRRATATVFTRGVFGRGESEITHKLSRIVEASEIPKFGNDRDRRNKLHTTQRLYRFDNGKESPMLGLVVEFGLDALHAFVLFGDRTDIFLDDDLLSRGVADDLTEPAEMGGFPIGPSFVTNVLSEQEGLEAVLGGFEVFT